MSRQSRPLLFWPVRWPSLLVAAVSALGSMIVGISPARAQQLPELSIADLLNLPVAGALQTAQNEYDADASLFTNDPGDDSVDLNIATPAVARNGRATIMEFAIPYTNRQDADAQPCMPGMAAASPGFTPGSTHEITFDQNGGNVLWIS